MNDAINPEITATTATTPIVKRGPGRPRVERTPKTPGKPGRPLDTTPGKIISAGGKIERKADGSQIVSVVFNDTNGVRTTGRLLVTVTPNGLVSEVVK